MALAGLTCGLAASPLAGAADPRPPVLIGAALLLGYLARPRASSGRRVVTMAPLALAAALLGLGWGVWRVGAIDAGGLDLLAGASVEAGGHLTDPPRRSRGTTRIRLATPDGRLMVEARGPTPELSPGDAVVASGEIRDPLPWEEGYLRRAGIRDVLVASRVRPFPAPRGGLAGWLDGVRRRAEGALERGTPPAPATLLRGFVLGQDDRIDPRTVEAFRRSGLAHLLAVSGTNVMLLSLLAAALLGALGVPLRARLLWILALIAVYVPVAGAGPSIQRAGVMGAAGVIGVLASRPQSRWYALLLAAAATLALNPLACGEVGWQLSFAAVAGILVWAGGIGELLQRPEPTRRSPVRRAVAQGAGLTIAATLATAPLLAHHFDAFSITSLPANLLALPAIAPVMWLGMTAGAAGQAPGLPVEPITALGGWFAAYIGQVAEWMAAPGWAFLEVEIESPVALAAAYVLLGGALQVVLRWWRRRRALRLPVGAPALCLLLAAATSLLVPGAAESLLRDGPGQRGPPPGGIALSVLDAGQGDAILLEPEDGEPVLVDAGPAKAEVASQLRARGVKRLGALVITHPDADHAGGAFDVLAAIPTGRLIQANGDPPLTRAAEGAGTRALTMSAGDRLRSGSLRLEVLWPPARLLDAGWPSEEPNRLSLVLLARFKGFRALLTGDAEAEVTPLDPGPVDVLKVAHHGSEDAGLGDLLARTRPRAAVISAGAGNPYGHPSPSTLATLAEHGVATLRTDRWGEIAIEAARRRWRVVSP